MHSRDPIASTSLEPEVPTLSYPLTPEALTPVVRRSTCSPGRSTLDPAVAAGEPGGVEYVSWYQHIGRRPVTPPETTQQTPGFRGDVA